MNAQILIDNVDRTEYLVSLERSYSYCDVSQEFTLNLRLDTPTIDPYDTVVIYEEGIKVLTGYVADVIKNAPEAKTVVKGQDVYKKAVDYFVSTTYTTDFGQTTSYWITFFLDLVGLTPVFTDGPGPYIIAEQELGLTNISDIILPMLQYSGWYGRVDPNGTVIFGKINKAPTLPSIIEGQNIIDDEIERSYDKTRNKAVIFGGVDTTLNRFEPIISVRERELPFLPVDQTVVIGNPLISDQASADQFAQDLINEFAQPTQIKKFTILGNPLYQAGKYVEVYSDTFTGLGLVTHFESSLSEEGYIMQVVLDDVCPRVIANINHQPELYAGTWGAGVWAYNLYSGAWNNISAGLTNLYINDLSVDNGLYIAATPAGIYTKLASQNWVKQTLPLYSGATPSRLVYSGVYSNVFDLEVNALVTSTGDTYNYAWFYTGTLASGGSGFRWSGSPIYDFEDDNGGGQYYSATDLEGNYSTKFITTRWQLDNTQEKIFYTFSGKHLYSMGQFGEDNGPVVETAPGQFADDAAISHDMTRVAFEADIGDGVEIYTTNMQGGDYKRITNFPEENYFPSWSPDDSKIVFVHFGPSFSEIYVVNRDGTELTQVTNDLTVNTHEHPRFISDETIVYGRIIAGFYNIFAINIDGTNQVQLTNNSYNTRISTYSDNQLKLLYVADVGLGNIDAYTIGTTGANPTLLFGESGDISSPNLTDDARFIIYSANGKIYIAGLAHSVATRLTTGASAPGNWQSVVNVGDHDVAFYISSNTIRRVNDDATGDALFYTPDPGNLMGSMRGSRTKNRFASLEVNNILALGNYEKMLISDGNTISTIPTALDFSDTTFTSAFGFTQYDVHPTEPRVIIWKAKEPATFGNHKFDLYEIGSGAAGQLTTNEHLFTSDRPLGVYYSYTGSSFAYTYPGTPNKIYINGNYTLDGIFMAWSPISDDIIYYVQNGNIEDVFQRNLVTAEEVLVHSANAGTRSDYVEVSPDNKFIAVTETNGTSNPYLTYVSKLGSLNKTLAVSNGQPTPGGPDALWTSDSISIVYNARIIDDLFIVSPRIELASGTFPNHRSGAITAKTRVFETFDNQQFTLVFEDSGSYLENNVDTYSPIVVYGRDGNYYSDDFFLSSGIIASGLVTYDVASRWEDDTQAIYATTGSGIYRVTVEGDIPSLRNTVPAREIVTRYYGSGEIFFSVGGQVKKSLNNCATYEDISTGLPGPLITVLRLD